MTLTLNFFTCKVRNMRLFIRHPAEIPIQVSQSGQRTRTHTRARNLSLGGLTFNTNSESEPGTIVNVEISFVSPAFKTQARVVWCKASNGAYELGVEFLNAEDAFRARMVEQVCHIEHYRAEVKLTEGRALGTEEAAKEWISMYASKFPHVDAKEP